MIFFWVGDAWWGCCCDVEDKKVGKKNALIFVDMGVKMLGEISCFWRNLEFCSDPCAPLGVKMLLCCPIAPAVCQEQHWSHLRRHRDHYKTPNFVLR